MGKQTSTSSMRPLPVAPDDPLAEEHRVIVEWTTAASEALGPDQWYRDVDLKLLPTGQTILAADADAARRYVMAALAQVIHWDAECDRVRSTASNETMRHNPHMLPGWSSAWGPRRHAAAVMFALLKRTLPLTESDLISLLDWASSQTTGLSNYHVPVGGLVKAVERHAKLQKPEGLFQDSVRRFVEAMRASHSKDVRRHATTLEQYCIAVEAKASDDTVDARPVVAAAAGHPAVLTKLKSRLGIPVDETTVVESTPLDPDHFPLRHDSPYEHEHRLLSGLFQQLIGPHYHEAVDLSTCDAGRTVLKMTPAEQGRMLLAACERVMHGLLSSTDLGDAPAWQASYIANSSVETIAGLDCSLDRAEIFDAMLYCSTRPSYEQTKVGELVHDAVSVLLNATEKPSLSEGERYVLSLLRTSLIKGPPLGAPGDDIVQLTRLIGDGAAFYLTPTEKWSVMLNQEIAGYPLDQRSAWVALLRHCVGATASRPSDKWLKQAAKLVEQIGVDIVRSSLLRWFSKVPAGRVTAGVPAYHLDTRSTGDIIQEENSTILRGLLWITPTLNGGDEMTRQIGVVANSAYKKVPGVGPRAVKVGNAAIYALSEIGTELAVGQLAMLKVRVKFGAAQKEIEKAFNVAAERLGLPREEIEELGVPSYGLEEVGLRRETFGDAQAELRVDGRDVALHWTNNGKPVKSVPAKVKADHKDDLKELQSAVKDIAAMLPAQSERLDAMFLLQKRWPVDQWRARYLDHPLVGTLARRLIWTDGAQAFVHHNDRLVDAQDREVVLASEAQVTLWHPIDRPTDEVLTWRDWFTRHEIRQPFKQAHREVYLLTDAERNTHTYSNRYAAHILRQHQFNALCAARGWKNKLRLMVDNDYPPTTRLLPQWGLRAEYWVEGIGGDYGTDTNESGAFLRLVTDQVRFYRIAAAENYAHAGGGGYTTNARGAGEQNINEPLPLDQIPPLVFSEIMRDVDLFVGVASVGNDPNWADGGPEGRYQTYWQSYAFGELTESAKTRFAVLEKLLPRLTKLKGRWELNGKFLVIEGKIRTYFIHLGSGNILMAPNDEYLCIVPDRSSKAGGESVFLPFEGDGTMSIILSKAFLLVDDDKIKDPTIVRQIRR